MAMKRGTYQLLGALDSCISKSWMILVRCCICCQRSIGCSSETFVEGKYEKLEAADKLLAVYFLEMFFLGGVLLSL